MLRSVASPWFKLPQASMAVGVAPRRVRSGSRADERPPRDRPRDRQRVLFGSSPSILDRPVGFDLVSGVDGPVRIDHHRHEGIGTNGVFGSGDRPIACPLRRDCGVMLPRKTIERQIVHALRQIVRRAVTGTIGREQLRSGVSCVEILSVYRHRARGDHCMVPSTIIVPRRHFSTKMSPSHGRAGSFRFLLTRTGRKCGSARPT
jgi:hypothetical protein